MANLDTYVRLIEAGEIVAFPTETVYGLGADAWNPSAIQKVFEVKGRPSDNPLIVHVSSEEQIHDFAEKIPPIAHTLIEKFWPGPLSLVMKKKADVLDAVTAGLQTVAIRMPNHPTALDFISKTGPLVAPSANKSGRPSPTKAEHVHSDFGAGFPVIDGEATEIGLESTVIDLSEPFPAILRPGSISRKHIEEALGMEVYESFFHHLKNPRSPGQKYSHYKPAAEVRWLTDTDNLQNSSTLFLLMDSDSEASNVVSYRNDLNQLAKELYDRYRQADHEGYESIVIEPFETIDPPIKSALLNRIEKTLK
ncbi:MAG: threonylcarbamoyl-AMP synthase [Balneolales bacterium]|nr:threonylcarbamoyl-AMP synthase [Balneolales bacterium]